MNEHKGSVYRQTKETPESPRSRPGAVGDPGPPAGPQGLSTAVPVTLGQIILRACVLCACVHVCRGHCGCRCHPNPQPLPPQGDTPRQASLWGTSLSRAELLRPRSPREEGDRWRAQGGRAWLESRCPQELERAGKFLLKDPGGKSSLW